VRARARAFPAVASLAGLGLWASCGSNGGNDNSGGACVSPALAAPAANTVALVVDSGSPQLSSPYTNGLFTSVTLCMPGTTTCQTIDHFLVDTGSVGVRVLESVLALPLPLLSPTDGTALAECSPFVDGSAWGPVRLADVQLSQEVASSIPIQTIGESALARPAACSAVAVDDLNSLGSNGILGVGVFPEDCGAACTSLANLSPGSMPYFSCSTTSGDCTPAATPLTQQVAHPVASFPTDNNGVIIQLPCVPAQGSPLVHGVMIFGIGTEANNGLGSAQPLPLDLDGFVTTDYPEGGSPYTSYLDSGSNALFFLNSATTGISPCPSKGLSQFYCPSSTISRTAEILSSAGAGVPIMFSVTNAAILPASSNAFSNLAGPMQGFPSNPQVPGFDWGLPFFFGRSVYTGISDQSGAGAYFAF